MNVDRLEANEASVAAVQADYLYLSSQTQDLSNLKTALVLFPEQVHLVTLIESKHRVGGKMGTSFGSHPVVINSLADVGPGITVGTAGGGKVTAALIKQSAGLQYTIVPMDTSQNVLNALLAGQIDVALVVGAAPMDLFRNAPPTAKAQIKFVPVPENMISNLKGYIPSKVGYPGINNGSSAQTIAVQSLLVTQNYGKKQPMAQAVYAFKQCLINKAEDQAGVTGSHPAWRAIKADAVGKWPMWEYEPTVTVSAAPSTQAKKIKK